MELATYQSAISLFTNTSFIPAFCFAAARRGSGYGSFSVRKQVQTCFQRSYHREFSKLNCPQKIARLFSFARILFTVRGQS